MTAIARIVGVLFLNMLATLGTTGLLAATPGAATDGNNSTQAFQKLSTLAGRWEATGPMGKVTTTYELISGGSVLLERLEVPGKEAMVTAYHLDGNRLILDHYCMAGNQPRLQAKPFNADSNEIDFDFVSAQNLASPNAGHMHQMKLRFVSPDEIAADWTWAENGQIGVGGHNVSLDYHRVK